MLKLYPPRKGLSQNWRIRGTYLGCRVDQSSGTHRRQVAAGILEEIAGNWRIRGTYLGCRVDQSSGTHRRQVAASILDEIAGKIERKEWPPSKGAIVRSSGA
jgi:hypothetical protein